MCTIGTIALTSARIHIHIHTPGLPAAPASAGAVRAVDADLLHPHLAHAWPLGIRDPAVRVSGPQHSERVLHGRWSARCAMFVQLVSIPY